MPDHLRHRTVGQLGFALAIALLAAVGMATVSSASRASESYAWVEHTYRVIATLQEYRASLRAAESAARGYRLVAQPALRDEFASTLPMVERELRTLSSLVADNPPQLARASDLRRMTAVRLRLGQALVDAGADTRATLAAGARQMADIEALVAGMLQVERSLLDARREQTTVLGRRLLAFSAGGILLAVLLIVGLMRGLVAEVRRRRSLETQARQAAVGLEASLARLQQVSDQRGALGRYASLLQSCADVDEALRVTGQVVAELLPAIGGRCYLLRASQDLGETAVTFGHAPIASADLLHPTECWALRRGQPYRADDVRTGVACAHLAAGGTDEAWSLCVPLLAQGTPLGLLHVAGTPVTDRMQAQELLVNVAEQLGLALVNLQLREKLRMQSLRDPLTGLYNRRYLDESLQREVTRCLRRGLPLAVLMVDVDHFKSFNDAHGHAAGDALLGAIAQALQDNTRGEDMVCRYGGEEFTVVLAEAAQEDALRRAEEIREAVAVVTVQYLRQTLGPRTASIGLAMLPDHGQTPALLLQRADAALYRAKREGRNRVVVADPPPL